MTRCNGFCSVGRAIPAKRTRAGRAAPSAGREAPCFAAPREYSGEVDGEALAKVHSLKISEDRAQKRRSPEKPRPYARDRRASRTLMLLIIQVEACRTTEADRRAKIKLVAED